MSAKEPSILRVLEDSVAVRWLMRGIYRRYAQGLGLCGEERVLEVGQGSGALSRFLAALLDQDCGELVCADVSRVWLDVARRKLRRFPHVEYKLGAVTELGLEDNYFDAVVVHCMLHDVDAELREELVRALAKTLKPGGKLFLREPMRTGHGLPVEEIRRLMSGAGLREASSEAGRMPHMGPTFAAVFVKPGASEF